MHTKTLTYFSQLLESLAIAEASTAMSQIKNFPRANELIRLLHKGYSLPDDIQWAPDRLDPELVKPQGSHRKITLIGAPRGVAAFVVTSTSYPVRQMISVIWMDDEGHTNQEQIGFDDWPHIIQYLKNDIGEFEKIVSGQVTYQQHEKKLRRKTAREEQYDLEDMTNYLFARGKTLWQKLVRSAYEDVKGVIVTLIKHDALERAGNKLDQLHRMHTLLIDLETTNLQYAPHNFESIIRRACFLTVQHYWPGPESRKPVEKIYLAVKSGRMDVLSTFLNFVKRELLSRAQYL